MPESIDNTALAEDTAAHGTALLIIDMLSNWRFPDGDALLRGAAKIAPQIAALKARCSAAGIPSIYANDNQGRWRSDFREVVECARREGGAGCAIAEQLAPTPKDYFILKPKHSAFHATPLDLLLRHLGASRLLLTGVSTDQCVLYTAIGARMLDYEIVAPEDAVATLGAARGRAALEHLRDVLGAETGPSDGLPGGR